MTDTITAHIELDDDLWQRLGRQAHNSNVTTADLVRKILRGWLDQQVIVGIDDNGYVIQRAAGELVGPFFTRDEAEQYLAPGDEVVVFNEHGNVIDYGPQFDEADRHE